MHHRPPREPRAPHSAAPARSPHRPSPRRALVVFTVGLAIATGAVLLGRLPTHADPGTLTQDAAAQRSLPAGGAHPRSAVGQAATTAAPADDTAEAAGTDGQDGHRGDHLREAGQQDAAEANPNCTLVVPGDPTSAA